MFQSTRPQGARLYSASKGRTEVAFQSTRPQGARLMEAGYRVSIEAVSIHAPAGGATLGSEHCKQGAGSFNPRARRGRDGVVLVSDDETKVSIHAPAGGATSHVVAWESSHVVSIHAPAGGATWLQVPGRAWPGFQSTRPQGARLMLYLIIDRRDRVSIHAPAGGATELAA